MLTPRTARTLAPVIAGIGSCLPERVLTNAELEAMVDTSDEWIVSRTGISERRIADEGTATSDLAAEAARRALACAGIAPADVDLIVLATTTPDMIMPSCACLVQQRIGASCAAYDVNAACTGFIYALHAGCAAIRGGMAETVLVIGADVMSRIIDFTDRSTCVLFGDGAGAVVLRGAEDPGIMSVRLGADGAGADFLKVTAGGSAAPATAERLDAHEQFIKMNGPEVYKFAVRIVPKVTRAVLKECGLGVEDLAWFVPHQANLRIMEAAAEKLHVPRERVFSNVERVGNTSAASIPAALDDLYTSGRLVPGDAIVAVGFGAGLTWGAAALRWTLDRAVGKG